MDYVEISLCRDRAYHLVDDEWTQECNLIAAWCAVLGKRPGDYSIQKPEQGFRDRSITVQFHNPLVRESQRDIEWDDACGTEVQMQRYLAS